MAAGAAACLATTPATAEAWVQPSGQTQAITGIAPRGGTGEPEVEVYLERGLGRGFSLIASPLIEVPREGVDGFERLTALRYGRALGDGGWVGAVQLGVVEAQWWDPRRDLARREDHYTTVDTRVAVGRNFGGGYWLDLSASVRGCPGPLGWRAPPRWAAAAGRNHADGAITILKAWSSGAGCGEPSVTFQASRVVPLTERIGIEQGWRVAGPVRQQPGMRGADAPAVSGPVVAIWVRY